MCPENLLSDDIMKAKIHAYVHQLQKSQLNNKTHLPYRKTIGSYNIKSNTMLQK